MSITVDELDGVLHAVMRHSPANVLDQAMVTALGELVDEFARGRAEVLLLSSGLPGVFAEGVDLSSRSLTVEDVADYRDAVRRPLERLAGCKRPSIAAISGRALGGGLELALACTLRFCTRGATLGFPDITRGLIPAAGGTQRLPRLIGSSRALELLLSGREITGEEAWRIGLVERLLDEAAGTQASMIAAGIAHASARAVEALMDCVEAVNNLPHGKGMAVEGVALLSILDEDDSADARARARSRLLASP